MWLPHATSSRAFLTLSHVCDIPQRYGVLNPSNGESMFPFIKRLLGWTFGLLFALVIVIAVRFFERRLRFKTRRSASWRAQTLPEPASSLPAPEPSTVL
jgi:hypothetical protein